MPRFTMNLDPRTMALVGAVLSAALVAGVGALAQVLGGGDLQLSGADTARIIASALTGGLTAYAQSTRSQSG